MAKTNYVTFKGKARYAKVFEGQQDLGTNLPEGDQKAKFESVKGYYTLDVEIDKETKKKMIADGIPGKGMAGQLFKEVTDKETGEDILIYRTRREVFNPKFVDKNTGETGVFRGPPSVVGIEGGATFPWNREEHGDIGNGSDIAVKVSVWNDSKVTLEAIRVDNLVEYVRNTTDDVAF